MIEIKLPWPPAELSPNARHHWAVVSKAKRQYRTECKLLTLACGPYDLPAGGLLLDLTFYPPQKRSYDRDNLVARMKAGLDGLADGLAINDKRFTTLAARVASTGGAYISVRISGDEAR